MNNAQLPTINTTRLSLRWIRPEDVDDFYAVYSNAEVMRYWSTPPLPNKDAASKLIEEIHDLSADMMSGAYEQAVEWLKEAQSYGLLLRFKAAGSKLAARLRTNTQSSPSETLLKRKKCKEELLQVEEKRIRKALAEANGSVTHAAPLIGVTYPGLIYIIKSRHPHLLDERTPVRQRQRRK